MSNPRELIPQEPPMLVVSSILSYSPDKGEMVAEMNVSEGCFYFDKVKRGVSSLYAIEYIAQAAGCLISIEDRNLECGLDLLIVINAYSTSSPFFYEKNKYRVKIVKKERIEGLMKAEGTILNQDDKIVCKANAKLYRNSK